MYRSTRLNLTNGKDPSALEIKTSVKGLIQLATRNQCSLENSVDSPIIAMTGFQKHLFSINEIIKALRNTIGNNNKLLYLQNRLTGALDNYKYKKQVSMLTSIRSFKTVFDTKRLIILNENDTMLFTLPFNDVEQAMIFRTLMNSVRNSVYSHKFTNKDTFVTSPNAKEEVLKYFIRICTEFINNFNDSNVYNIVEIIKLSGIKKSTDSILNLITEITFNRGVIMNKLNINKVSIATAKKLYDACIDCSSFNKFSFTTNNEFKLLFLSKFDHLLPPLPNLSIASPVPLALTVPVPPIVEEVFDWAKINYYTYKLKNLFINLLLNNNKIENIFIPLNIKDIVFNNLKSNLFSSTNSMFQGIDQTIVEKLLNNIVTTIIEPVLTSPTTFTAPAPVILPIPILPEEVITFNTGSLNIIKSISVPIIPIPPILPPTDIINITGTLKIITSSPTIISPVYLPDNKTRLFLDY
jgi:hypothetical protein